MTRDRELSEQQLEAVVEQRMRVNNEVTELMNEQKVVKNQIAEFENKLQAVQVLCAFYCMQ